MKQPSNDPIVAHRIRVKGLVQGVGFRPFVYRLAIHYGLNGWVANGTDGVSITIEGKASVIALFLDDLKHKAPAASQIEEITTTKVAPERTESFSIQASEDLTDETSEISPDIAVCPDCIADMKKQPHRLNYPFINCTHCGPRFSIIRDFPYDRAKTTMAPFIMCSLCHAEYTDILDRRFHAQPVACNQCGPKYFMHLKDRIIDDPEQVLALTAEMIEKGSIIAVKGIGGFHLMCNSLDEQAVGRLRKIKIREGKPFAVMFRDLEKLREYAEVSDAEAGALESWRRPVVILKMRKVLAGGVSPGLDTLGAYLPFMPFHYLLFEQLTIPSVVLTSGNIANEPIIIDDQEALNVFTGLTDAVITYNRDIYNRTDDSVVRVIAGKERIQRRSRGYAPAPIRLGFKTDGILATGAELSNCFCIGKGNRAYLSQHIGDLKNYETFAFFEEAQSRFRQIFRIKPVRLAADMHPDYLSTRFARKTGLETIPVQHHHAHIASCMAENGLDEQVIGLAFDGTGYGTDGNIWGSEFMICDFEKFERVTHFAYMPLPGGDRAAEEPWRMGLSLLYMAYGESMTDIDLPFLRSLDPAIIKAVAGLLKKNINCPLSSGAGRLFDGIAAISGICAHSAFHAEAPMRLESAIDVNITDSYPFEFTETLSFLPAVRRICEDIISGIKYGIIAARFHNTVTEAAVSVVKQIRETSGLNKVVLSGGTFQNKFLSETLESALLKNNFAVYTHSKVPCNDGGIALGQLAIAARFINHNS